MLVPSSSVAEKRRACRYACVLSAERAGNEGSSCRAWPIRVVNISTLGIGMHAGEELEVGTVVSVRLCSLTGKWLPAVRVRVVHATEQDNGTWIMGAAFARPLEEEEVMALLA
ncbi:MAG: PilZ domain-containing protein [Gemmataceae bacterium]